MHAIRSQQPIRRSVEAKPSFMTLGSAVASDHVISKLVQRERAILTVRLCQDILAQTNREKC